MNTTSETISAPFNPHATPDKIVAYCEWIADNSWLTVHKPWPTVNVLNQMPFKNCAAFYDRLENSINITPDTPPEVVLHECVHFMQENNNEMLTAEPQAYALMIRWLSKQGRPEGECVKWCDLALTVFLDAFAEVTGFRCALL